MKDYNDIKTATEQAVQTESELIDEADWMAHEKLTRDEVISISREHGLFDKSPTSYDSAHNRPIIEVLASKIADKLKREIEVDSDE